MKIHYPHPLPDFTPPVRGRGALDNPAGRFEHKRHEADADAFDAMLDAELEQETRQIPTQVFRDQSRTIVTSNDSPDIGMDLTVNPYRGCEHGCIYCFARPTHEYLGMSAGLDFESKLFVKHDAAALLREKLSSRNWQPHVLFFSGITDPYQPLERKLKITRACLQVLNEFGNPAALISKNHLVMRDVDVLGEMAARGLVSVFLSITTLDSRLARLMEPRASRPAMRLRAIETLAKAGVPTGVMIGPVLPGLTDHEIPAILEAAADAGAGNAGYTMLRLPYGVKDLFQHWLHEHFPDRAEKVLRRLREMHGGKLYDSAFGHRMRGEGQHAEHIASVFKVYRNRYGLTRRAQLSLHHFNREAAWGQQSLF
ncbi:MAG TPA: PA0069 family radical SAM protein [Candidatus Acidoferrum sp.]|nr:PA0069 family radical SAM protein [Candidatus Acidoferrum sp.]